MTTTIAIKQFIINSNTNQGHNKASIGVPANRLHLFIFYYEELFAGALTKAAKQFIIISNRNQGNDDAPVGVPANSYSYLFLL
ncbi:MAG: hypothetical protein WAU24_11815 [Chitinophagaceae bacterium]